MKGTFAPYLNSFVLMSEPAFLKYLHCTPSRNCTSDVAEAATLWKSPNQKKDITMGLVLHL